MASFQPMTKIILLKNIDIDVSYNHQFYFEDETSQYNFFYSKKFKELDEGTYQRKNLNTIQVNYQVDEIRECKYVMWQNANYSDKWYYAFVTKIDYVNPKVSTIRYELDVYQTYLFDMQWKESFIDRQHEYRYVNGLPIVNTLDEGLDYGSQYDILDEEKLEQIPNVAFLVIGDTLTSSRHVTQKGVPTNISYHIVPMYLNELGYTRKDITLNGTTLSRTDQVLDAYRNNTTLVNSLVSAYITPYLPIDVEYTETSTTIAITSSLFAAKTYEGITYMDAGYNYYEILQAYPTLQATETVYQNFPTYDESKLLMYPYSFTELTTKRGDSLIIKNEYFTRLLEPTRINNIKISVLGTVSFKNKIAFAINNYLGQIINVQNALIDNSNDNMPIIDDYTASYLQSNSNSMKVAESNARNLQQVEIENAQRTANTIGQNAGWNAIGQTLNNAGSIVSGALSIANPFGNGIGQMISGATGEVNAAIDFANTLATANTNLVNTTRSANVSYQNAVAGVQAKYQDAQQIPASTKSLGGDYMFNIANDCNKIYLVKKTITPEYREKLTNYFKQYGYKVNRLELPNFHTRENWNYIKMTEPNIYGNIPMDDLMKIRDIFIKGITLWHGDYVGDYTRANAERTNILNPIATCEPSEVNVTIPSGENEVRFNVHIICRNIPYDETGSGYRSVTLPTGTDTHITSSDITYYTSGGIEYAKYEWIGQISVNRTANEDTYIKFNFNQSTGNVSARCDIHVTMEE